VALLNSVPEINIQMPQHIARQLYHLQERATLLLVAAMQQNRPHVISAKIGRNDQCPCGSGKKYKKCHGSEIG
jgi:preprotein translocase subunit SecA